MRSLVVLAIVFPVMLIETRVSRRNERLLRARGAVEPPGDVYRAMQVLYPLAFLVPAAEGWLAPQRARSVEIAGLVIFLAAKALKYWAIETLGVRWTFKVLVPPGSQRTQDGPYRFLSHPNYAAVAGEIFGASLLAGGPWSGIAFTILFGSLMLRRIQLEERALS